MPYYTEKDTLVVQNNVNAGIKNKRKWQWLAVRGNWQSMSAKAAPVPNKLKRLV